MTYDPRINLRGRNYRKAMTEWTPLLVADARKVHEQKQKLSPIDIARIAIKHNFPMKTTFQFLEYDELIPTGTWDRLMMNGITAGQLVEAAQESNIKTHLRHGADPGRAR